MTWAERTKVAPADARPWYSYRRSCAAEAMGVAGTVAFAPTTCPRRVAIEHCGNVLEQLESTVECAAVDQVERDVGILVENAVSSRGAGDHREDDHTGAVDKTPSMPQ